MKRCPIGGQRRYPRIMRQNRHLFVHWLSIRLKMARKVSGTLSGSPPVDIGPWSRLCFSAHLAMAVAMPLHIIKLCVGCDSLSDLAGWQKTRLKQKRAKGQKAELVHVTRMMPKRAEEVLDGGSLGRRVP